MSFLFRELQDIMVLYDRFVQDTFTGLHGATAQFWIAYIQMIHIYFEFGRSIRTSDFDLYVYCLPKISQLFFIFNQPNYAWWMVRYHDNLLHIKETHPQVEEDFRGGSFAVRRTEKAFSKMPVDLTLEQTINADAASQKTGIRSFTNSISARQRWANSHSLSVSILSYLMDGSGLAKKEDVSSDLRTTKMKKNAADIKSIKQAINNALNPFLPGDLDPSILYNIGSGKAASSTTAAFLLNVNAQAIEKQNKFIEECHSNPSRFEMETIKRLKLHTFAEEDAIVTKKKDGKIFQTRMERDLFARVLYIAFQRKIDMGELLKYPLTPVPLSLCH